MIRPLRVALFIVTLFLSFQVGLTLERLLLEVARVVFPIRPSNALGFNALHLALSLLPLLALGGMLHIALAGEDALRARMWQGVLGMAFGLAAVRLAQIWWVLREGGVENMESGAELLSPWESVFFENLLPYFLMGLAVGFVHGLSSKSQSEKILDSALGVGLSILWLGLAGRLREIAGTQIFSIILTAVLASLATAFIVDKSVESGQAAPTDSTSDSSK